MFGHQDDQPAQQDDNAADDTTTLTGTDENAAEPTDKNGGQPADQAGMPDESAAGSDTALADENGDTPEELVIGPGPDQTQDDQPKEDAKSEPPAGDDWQHPGTPLDDSEPEPISDVISPAGGFPKRPTFQYPVDSASDSAGPSGGQPDSGQDQELVDIRKRALGELSPLVEKLDLPPDEKFRTVMMIIQTSDDESLVKKAYEAAKGIEDEKARAQALLDIVNEVNYFTQPPADQAAN